MGLVAQGNEQGTAYRQTSHETFSRPGDVATVVNAQMPPLSPQGFSARRYTMMCTSQRARQCLAPGSATVLYAAGDDAAPPDHR